MLVHRLRRWPNIKQTLAQRLVFDVFSGVCGSQRRYQDEMMARYRLNSVPTSLRSSLNFGCVIEEY